MRKISLIMVLFLLGFSMVITPVKAQQTRFSNNPEAMFRSAVKLFEKEKYGAAMEQFLLVLEMEPEGHPLLLIEAEYYYALCAMQLYNPPGEDLLSDFVEENPENSRVRSANYLLASHQFERKRYKVALRSLEKVNTFDLERKQIPVHYFMLGYCQFRSDQLDKAKKNFSQVPYQHKEYGSLARYFNAHIAYLQGDYDYALKSFEAIALDPAVKSLVPYYIAQIHFLKGDYARLLEVAPSLMSNTSPQRKPEIQKMIGEANYKLGQYEQALPYLQGYMDQNGFRPTRDDYYQMGFALYQAGKFSEAIPHLKEATYTPDSLAQNAYYHLADCFLKSGDKTQAIESFNAAYKLGFIGQITEDALFNYAKLSYELSFNPYNKAIKAFQDYLQKYPNSKRVDEVNSYLVSLYLSTRNYKSALESIEGIKNKNKDLLEAQQRIYYYRGVELFNDNKIQEAISLFDQAIKGNNDPAITASARFWKAEGLYRTGDIDGAIRQLDAFRTASVSKQLPFYEQVHYNLGYAYFNKKQYSKALESFNAFIRNPGSAGRDVVTDARLRAGDCNYMNRDYATAISLYDEVISLSRQDADYALFQKAIATRVMGSFEMSNQVLLDLISRYPKSPYVDDARFIVGDNYMTYLGQPAKALQTFESIVRDSPKSQFALKSLLKIGLIHYNTHDYLKARETFERVAEQYPGTEEARDAVEFIRNIYIELDQVDQFVEWASKVPNVNISNADVDSTTYTAAENNYIKGNFDRAIKGFADYLNKFPNGFFVLEARFYKAECDMKQGNMNDALSGYEKVADMPLNRFSEEAVRQSAGLNFNSKNYKKAIEHYKRLEGSASYKSDIILGRTGQMRCYALLDDHENTIRSAEKLLSSDRLAPDLETEAHLRIARAAFAIDSIPLAEKEFRIVVERNSSEQGAEAKFFVSEILFNKNLLKEAEKSCFELVDRYSSYDYWVARTFILLSDIYLRNNNAFQAKHTLQSIIDNYQGEDLVNLAKSKLQAILDAEKAKQTPPQATPGMNIEDGDDE
jgi:TolA-binding protein